MSTPQSPKKPGFVFLNLPGKKHKLSSLVEAIVSTFKLPIKSY